ncbi:hypothetical protein PAMP_014335 [Pampus punctatissimus]
MLRPTFFCLLLACVVSLSSSAVVLDNGMPILWAHTAGQVTDLPIQNGILTSNPWNFLNRMSLCRLMIAATDPFMGSMGTNPTDSPLWGIPLQLGWMLTSGVNYFTSALSFLSAAQHGLMGAGVQMQVPAGVEDYCTTYADCASRYPDVMAKWDSFFTSLKAAAESPLPDNEKKDSILGLYWEAQMASTHALAACSAKQSYYSSSEVSFANSWVNSAEYVAAKHFHSNLEKSVTFMIPLPSRVLREGDNAPFIADLSQEENHTLSVFSWMKNVNNLLSMEHTHIIYYDITFFVLN